MQLHTMLHVCVCSVHVLSVRGTQVADVRLYSFARVMQQGMQLCSLRSSTVTTCQNLRCAHVVTKPLFAGVKPADQQACSRSTVLRSGLLLVAQRPVLSAWAHTMAPSVVSRAVKLNTGSEIPAVGLGVFLVQPGQEAYKAVASALSAGYRHIDTAKMYRNEADVGKAIKDSAIPRENVFVTSKLYSAHWGYDQATRAIKDTLQALDTSYVDLMLMHHPAQREGRQDTWRALEDANAKGLCKNIGVSNFGIGHLDQLLKHARVTPAVNQIELSPFLQRQELVDYCRSKDIALEAYSPLCRASKLSDPTIAKIAKRHGKSAAQVLVRWSLQKGFIPLPKSVKAKRQSENIDVFDFELGQQDMSTLDKLESYYVVSWDPITQDPV